MVWRHVGVIGSGHRLCTTTPGGTRHAGTQGRCEQSDDKGFYHSFSPYVLTTHRSNKHALDIQVPIYDAARSAASALRAVMALIAPQRAGWAPFAYAAALIVILLGLALSPDPARAGPEIGEAAPPLILTTLDGSTFDLAKLRGKVVMVNYWATWCAPCRQEMPKLDAFYKKYQSQGLEIVGISIDFDRDVEKARKAARGVVYPMALAKAITTDGFGIPKGVPITWIIDTDGKVRDRFIEVRDELLDGIVVPLLPH
jgi:cytochrome c biogenesis protein CcmG, thiol:disulfide interchange protein DsbE